MKIADAKKFWGKKITQAAAKPKPSKGGDK